MLKASPAAHARRPTCVSIMSYAMRNVDSASLTRRGSRSFSGRNRFATMSYFLGWLSVPVAVSVRARDSCRTGLVIINSGLVRCERYRFSTMLSAQVNSNGTVGFWPSAAFPLRTPNPTRTSGGSAGRSPTSHLHPTADRVPGGIHPDRAVSRRLLLLICPAQSTLGLHSSSARGRNS